MTENTISIQANTDKLSKRVKAIILALPIIISFFQVRVLDCDFYFLYSIGDYIVHHGFPFTDVLSMHSSMRIVVQQWLSSVIFYYVYTFLGKYGVISLVYICNTVICYFTYRITVLISKNDVIAVAVAALTNFFVFDAFMVTRPQIFTYTILMVEIYLLEMHVQTKKSKYLIGIPVLSLLLINLHAAMWLMLFVFMLPYLLSAIPVKIENFKKEAQGNFLYLIAVAAVSGVAGLLNPYGIDNMLYLFSSYGEDSFTIIMEMKPTSLHGSEGNLLFITLGITIVILCFIRKKVPTIRFFLLFFGTLVLGLLQLKGIPYFMLFGVPAFTYVLRDLSILNLAKPIKKIMTKTAKVLSIIFFSICFIYVCEARFFITNDIKLFQEDHLSHLDDAIEILDKVEGPVILYTNFNDGQYLEFNGYHPYIDGRAEVFLKSNNKEYDYFYEYASMFDGGIYYRDFIDKYDFNYLIIHSNTDCTLYNALIHDEDFEIVYWSYDVNLFVRKTAE